MPHYKFEGMNLRHILIGRRKVYYPDWMVMDKQRINALEKFIMAVEESEQREVFSAFYNVDRDNHQKLNNIKIVLNRNEE